MANTVRGHIEQLCRAAPSAYVSTPESTRSMVNHGALWRLAPDEAAAAATLGSLLNEADGGRFPLGVRHLARPSTSICALTIGQISRIVALGETHVTRYSRYLPPSRGLMHVCEPLQRHPAYAQ